MRGEKEVLLDDLLLEIDEHEESKRKEEEDRHARASNLMEARRLIRTKTLQQQTNSRSSRGIGSVDEGTVEDEDISANVDRRKSNSKLRGVFCD